MPPLGPRDSGGGAEPRAQRGNEAEGREPPGWGVWGVIWGSNRTGKLESGEPKATNHFYLLFVTNTTLVC